MEFQGLPPHWIPVILRKTIEYHRLNQEASFLLRNGQPVPQEIRTELKRCESDLHQYDSHDRIATYYNRISGYSKNSCGRLIARITRTGCCKNCQSSVPRHLLPRIIQQLALAACDGCQAILLPASFF